MGSSISVRAFGSRNFSCRKVSAEEVKEIIETTLRNNAQIKGYFKFGPVPSKKEDEEFSELLRAFKKIVDYEPNAEIFFHRDIEDSNKFFPNFNFAPQVDNTTRMLAVEYYFSLDTEKFLDSDSSKNDLSVSSEAMDFYIFESH